VPGSPAAVDTEGRRRRPGSESMHQGTFRPCFVRAQFSALLLTFVMVRNYHPETNAFDTRYALETDGEKTYEYLLDASIRSPKICIA
jgi:hypothetical protein